MSWRRGIALAAALAGMPAMRSVAATPLESLRCSTDITVNLGAAVVDDEGLATDDLAGGVTVGSVGASLPQADLDALHVLSDGDQLLSFDTAVALPGGLVALPGDVVRFDGASHALQFAAAAEGVPRAANVDAVAIRAGSLLLSFDDVVDLGAGLVVDDEDLVLFDGVWFSLFFDGSAAGVAAGLDLDAADHVDCNGHLLLSFDGSGTLGSVSFDDEDVLEYDMVASWEKTFDGSAHHAAWGPADLDAVDATVDLGPGPPSVFGQTILAEANKVDYTWPNPVPFQAVRGAFASSADIGTYVVDMTLQGNASLLSDFAMPAPGAGYWYLVKPGGCVLSSWQSTLGAEPGRDAALP